jgi:hypothetical protein
VLGAGAEVGPLPVLLSWGARVIGIDLPRPAIWDRVLETAKRSGGTLLVPVADAKPGQAGVDSDEDLTQRAGFDLAGDIPAVADWLAGLDGPLVLGNYVYADGAANVRVASAVDALTVRLQAERRDVALAFLATPTDVFAVPPDAVAQSARAYAGRPAANKLGRGLLRSLSGGRLLRRAYPPGSDPGICDSLVAQQGPNYALAKRLQRWRATIARDGGAAVSMNVAPPTRTRSVTRNRVLAAAYAGAGRFGVEVFEPATTKALMAALLVHDLHAGPPAGGHPWQDEAYAAAHGGLWRMAYAPRSALTLAALLGYGAARKSLPDQGKPVVRVLRDHGLDDPAGHELVHLHGREVPRSDGAGRHRAGLLDGLAERLGQDPRHVRGRLALDHGVGVPVDNGPRLRARVDEEAGPVPRGPLLAEAADQHPGQADRDVEVAGQLEYRPVRQVRINRNQPRGRGPFGLGQAAEGRLDPGQLVGERVDGGLV